MDSEQFARLLPEVRQVAIDAGERILEVCRTGYEVYEKADRSPVTTADLAAHECIFERLEVLGDRWPVLSEENPTLPTWETRRDWDTYWLVDPLDGTRELLRQSKEFTVNIALIHQQQPVLGVIGAPALGLLYYAHRAGGAWRIQEGKEPVTIHSRPFPADGSSVVAVSFSHARPEVQRFLRRLGPHQEKRVGSSLKSCQVAEGSLDLYPRYGSTHEWDTAAAQCIVEEAGGHLLDWKLQPLRYNMKADLINPSFLVIGDPNHDWAALLNGEPQTDAAA